MTPPDSGTTFAAFARALVERRDRVGADGLALVARFSDGTTLGDLLVDVVLVASLAALTRETIEIDRDLRALSGAALAADSLRLGLDGALFARSAP